MSDPLHAGVGTIAPSPSISDIHQAVIDNLPMMISVYEVISRTSYRMIMVNRALHVQYAQTEVEPLGKYLDEILPATTMPKVIRHFQACLDSGQTMTIEDSYEVNLIGTIWTVSRFTPLATEDGHITHVLVSWEDITERKKREWEAQQEQLAIIEHQAAQLMELSTPLLTLGDSTLVMPLIGAIDDQRVQHLLESLLTGVSVHRATRVILDITGVPVVDTYVANALVRASQAVRLLGAQVILTGIRPEVAQTLVGLGADLSSIVTRGTLRDGIAYALR